MNKHKLQSGRSRWARAKGHVARQRGGCWCSPLCAELQQSFICCTHLSPRPHWRFPPLVHFFSIQRLAIPGLHIFLYTCLDDAIVNRGHLMTRPMMSDDTYERLDHVCRPRAESGSSLNSELRPPADRGAAGCVLSAAAAPPGSVMCCVFMQLTKTSSCDFSFPSKY